MDGQFKARELRESKQFLEQLKQIHPNIRRLDEQLFGITWVLSRRPDIFPQIGNTLLHRALIDPWPGAPRLRIYFTFDDQHVDLLWVEQVEELDEDS